MNHEPQPADDEEPEFPLAPTYEEICADINDYLAKCEAREQYERAYRFNREGDGYHTDIGDVPCNIAIAAYESKTAKEPNVEPFYLRMAYRGVEDAKRQLDSLPALASTKLFYAAVARVEGARRHLYAMLSRYHLRQAAETRR